MLKPSCAHDSRRPTDSAMTASFLIIRGGRSSSIGARFLYRSPLRLPEPLDPAAVFEELFGSHGWRGSWRDGVYDYAHYHSRTHEVLGVARGSGRVRFGSDSGRALNLKAGDVAILPAGTGHQCLKASNDFLVVGAYPESGAYDECKSREDGEKALPAINRVDRPARTPCTGKTVRSCAFGRREAPSSPEEANGSLPAGKDRLGVRGFYLFGVSGMV